MEVCSKCNDNKKQETIIYSFKNFYTTDGHTSLGEMQALESKKTTIRPRVF